MKGALGKWVFIHKEVNTKALTDYRIETKLITGKN